MNNCFRPELVLDCLKPAIPRQVYDNVLQYPDIDAVFLTLHDKQNIRESVQAGNVPAEVNRESTPGLKQVTTTVNK